MRSRWKRYACRSLFSHLSAHYDTDVSCCNGGRLDGRTLALLEHVLVRSTPFSPEGIGVPRCRRRQRPAPTSSLPHVNWSVAGLRGPMPSTAAREVEQGDAELASRRTRAWPQLGIFGVALARRVRRRGRHRRRPVRDGRRSRRCDGSRSDRHHGACHAGRTEFAGRPAGGAGLRRAHRRAGAHRRPEIRRRPGIGHRRIRAGRRSRRGAAAAGVGYRVPSRRRHRRRCHGRTADRPPTSPARWPGWCSPTHPPRSCRCRGSASRISPRPCWPPRPPGWPGGHCRPPPNTRRFASSSASRSAASRRSSTCAPRCCCAPSRSRGRR